jgi:hypothetical protein
MSVDINRRRCLKKLFSRAGNLQAPAINFHRCYQKTGSNFINADV